MAGQDFELNQMFISETHLPQLLKPEHYFAADQHEVEVQQLFKPGWHCVGTLADLPRAGSYLTLTLLGVPLLVRSGAEEVQAYLNVCSHRSCKLRSDPCGLMAKLQCQYHGWEYGDDGNTNKIPDAKSFKPLKKGQLGLTTFPTETVGQLIFVSINQNPQPLKEFLGPAFDLCLELYAVSAEQILAAVRPNRANWKVSLENSLEGYHLEMVHGDTFSMYPPESHCEHQILDPNKSSLRVESQGPKNRLEKLGNLIFKMAGVNVDTSYYQFHVYPNLVIAKFGMFSWLEVVLPDSPNDSHDIWRFFSNIKRPGFPRTYLPAAILKQWGKRWFAKVIAEDEAIFPAIQGGLESPTHPGTGLVSVREERIFHFQRYILDHADALGQATSEIPSEAPPIELTNA